jgi:hypothetical protein
MSTATKPSKEAADKIDAAETFLPLYTKGVEQLAAIQTKSLEVAAQQNANWIAACKKAFNIAPTTPVTFWMDLAERTFDKYVEIQKDVIDLTVEQTQSVAKIAKETEDTPERRAALMDVFHRSIERSVAAQHKALEFCAEQNKAACETVKRHLDNPVVPATESFRRGLDAMVETQKAMLEVAVKPLKSTTAA